MTISALPRIGQMDGIEGCGYGIFVFVIYELLLSRQLTIRYFNGIFRSGFAGAKKR